jgi:hypothetical protein
MPHIDELPDAMKLADRRAAILSVIDLLDAFEVPGAGEVLDARIGVRVLSDVIDADKVHAALRRACLDLLREERRDVEFKLRLLGFYVS